MSLTNCNFGILPTAATIFGQACEIKTSPSTELLKINHLELPKNKRVSFCKTMKAYIFSFYTKPLWFRDRVAASCSGGHEIESRLGKSQESWVFLVQSVTVLVLSLIHI